MSRKPRPSRARAAGCKVAFAIGLALTASIAACAPEAPPQAPRNNAFLVEPVVFSHNVPFENKSIKLDPNALSELSIFLNDIDDDRSSTIYVDAAGDKSAVRRGEIRDFIEGTGRQLIERDSPLVQSNSVLVSLRRNVIVPSACLEATGWPAPELLPAGCTNELNLIAMIENQQDLLEGRQLGLASAAPAGDLVRQHNQRFSVRPADENFPTPAPPLTTVGQSPSP